MKKRILALALAGTTAFSVFGAALSANAWSWPSTDTRYDVDAYVTYSNVAKDINITTDSEKNATSAYDKLSKTTFYIVANNPDAAKNQYASVDDYIKAKYDVQEEYFEKTRYTFTPELETVLENEYEEVTLIYGENSSGNKIIRIGNKRNDWMNKVANLQVGDTATVDGYTIQEVAGTYYMSTSDLAEVNTYGVPVGSIYYAGTKSSYVTEATVGSGVTIDETKKIDLTPYKVSFTKYNGKIENVVGLDITAETSGKGYWYVNDKGTKEYYESADALLTAVKKNFETGFDLKEDDLDRVDEDGTAMDPDVHPLRYYRDQISINGVQIVVIDEIGVASDYTKWEFNPNLTGEITIEPCEVATWINDEGKLVTEKLGDPTIYAFDFIPNNIFRSSASQIASAWNKDNSASVVNIMGAGNFDVETGRGNPDYGIRYDVVTEWQDFLEELALDNAWIGHYADFDEFCENYKDMFYSDAIYSWWTGQQIDSVNVDLYNIEELLWDIWTLRGAEKYQYNDPDITGYHNANTSELLYLMQQYDKYIGNYIDKTEVASDDWGDLLLSILDAATEEDFRNASEYKKYANKVEDLRDAYEMATTVSMIDRAEREMYALLISANTQFRSSAAPDKATLGTTLEDLYFNVGSVPTAYSVDPSNQSNNVDYYNYNYYVAALNVSNPNYSNANQNLQFTSTLAKGYYSLYPMLDYMDYDTSTPNEVYAGNRDLDGDFAGNGATEEYEWFWNVYQLAAKMNASGSGSSGNTKQGSVDAVNEALADAVANLAVTTTPNSTELGAVEDALEEYAGKIDTDYDEDYYAKYTQANDYAENVAEGKWQTRIAAMITGVAGEALTYQGTQVTITKNDMKTVETAIKNGETALKAIKEDPDYNAAQVTALNKAIATAEDLVSLYEGTYSTKKDDQSVNKVYTRLVGDKDQMVKSDLTKAIEAIDAAINYSEIVMGWSQNDAGKWMYGTEEGYLNDGWHQVDGGKTWFYFNADGTAKQSEWWNDNGTWYWFNSNCGAATGWAKVDGEWYFFKGNNAMKTGWEKVDGNWYYMASSGKMVTGWCEVSGKWYYFSKESNSLGQMLYSTTVDGYKLGADGAWIK